MQQIRRGVVFIGDNLLCRCTITLFREQCLDVPYYWFPTITYPSGWGPTLSPLTVHDHNQDVDNWTSHVIRWWLKRCDVAYSTALHTVGIRCEVPPELEDKHMTGLALCHDPNLSRPFACRQMTMTGVIFHPRMLEQGLKRLIHFNHHCRLIKAGSPIVRYRDELIVGDQCFKLSPSVTVIDFSRPEKALHWPYRLTTINHSPVYELENYNCNPIVSYTTSRPWRVMSRIVGTSAESNLDEYAPNGRRTVMMVPPGHLTPAMAIGHHFGFTVRRVYCGTVVVAQNRLTGRYNYQRSLRRDGQYWYVCDPVIPTFPSAIRTARWLIRMIGMIEE